MKNTYMCESGDCQDENCQVMVSDLESGTRKWFCTRAHAICWLLRRIEVNERNTSAATRESAQLAAEGIVRITADAPSQSDPEKVAL